MTRPASIQGRLLALITAVLGLVWLGTAGLIWHDAQHELDELLDAHLAQAAALLVAQQAHEVGERRDVDAPGLHRYAPRVAFQVFHEGRLSLRSANAPAAPMASDLAQRGAGFRSVTLDGERWRVFATAGSERDVQVYVGEQVASRSSILWAVLRGALGPALLALPLLLLGAWWSIARGLRPLRTLAGELGTRSPQALQPLLLDPAAAEIAPMVEELNRLFGRVSRLMELERRFTADAAHELRTPIAAIRAQAQVALNEGDEPARRRALRATLQGCDRAARLIDQLLTLSRLDADETQPREPVDVSALVRGVAAEIAPRALRKSQVLEVDARGAGTAASDPVLLAVLVRNLIDNAVRYAPPGARVQVTLRAEASALVLAVDDSGAGLAPDQLQRLGERFFRAAPDDESGSGLGWSIVQRVASVLGADVRASRSALGGLRVEVRLAGSARAP